MKPGICSAYSLRNLTGHDVLIWDRPAHNWDLAQSETQSGINALIKAQEQNVAGPAQVLYVDDARLIPSAWRGRDDLRVPQEKWTNESGWVDLWAPPRGYAVYVPV